MRNTGYLMVQHYFFIIIIISTGQSTAEQRPLPLYTTRYTYSNRYIFTIVSMNMSRKLIALCSTFKHSYKVCSRCKYGFYFFFSPVSFLSCHQYNPMGDSEMCQLFIYERRYDLKKELKVGS